MTKESPELREATVDDLHALCEVVDRVPSAPQWTRPVWTTALMPARDGVQRVVTVAVLQSLIVGFVVVAMYGDFAELESLAVLPAHRQQGIGRSLVERAMRDARTRGAAALQLEVSALNVAAGALYAAMGFVVDGVRPVYYANNADALLMHLGLVPPSPSLQPQRGRL